jgi:hypothetical protein
MSKPRIALLALIGAASIIAIAAGMGILWRYSLTPGTAGTPPAFWPAQSRLARKLGALTLAMVVHPHCPCTRASIAELEILMAHARGQLDAWVIFLKPRGFNDSWTKTSLWISAAAIPGVSAVVDDGAEARLFGAATSGQTMIYDRNGRLLFSGGITAARGHFGDNAGASAIAALLEQAAPRAGGKTAVYGCALFAPRSSPAKRGTNLCLK